jgi:hypothetical protein
MQAILSICALLFAAAAASAAPRRPVWLPASEPAPYIPEQARFLQGNSAPTRAADEFWSSNGAVSYARTTWRIAKPVRRAVLFLHAQGPIRAYFSGRLMFEPGARLWKDVADRTPPGPLFVALRSYGDYGAVFYAQMRVEYIDGSVEDFASRVEGWEVAGKPAADWAKNPAAAGDWAAPRDVGGYHPEPGKPAERHQEFAPLPKEGVRALFKAHNDKLERDWPRDRTHSVLRLDAAPSRADWAAQFQAPCRVNENGELVDGSGAVRHLLLAMYTNNGAYHPMAPEFDWDLLDRDLAMMAQAEVHPYMRFLGLSALLDKNGDWLKLPASFQPKGASAPKCQYAVELLDEYVRRAYAMGRYILFEADFYWNPHTAIPWAYRSSYHLYPELARANALAHRKVMARYAGCRNVLGYMAGEEDILVGYDLANPHQQAQFADFLRHKYGTLAEFKRRTRWAYDMSDTSGFKPGLSPSGYWESNWRGLPPEPVLKPAFELKEGVFDRVNAWNQVPLPGWPNFRSPEEPELELGGHREITNSSIPFDPLWTDFYEFQQDQLFYGFLSSWARTVREACPNQLLFFCNANDSEGSWHWPELFRRADLPFDVIGLGDHDYNFDLSGMEPWYTARKAIKTVAPYRPYVRAKGATPRGIATGEGEIGRKEHPEEVKNGYISYLFDEISGGCAWTQTYTWIHMTGGDTGAPNRGDTPFLQWCGPFLRAVQGVPFKLKRPVRVLLLRNYNQANSNMSGLDTGDMYGVSDALSRLNLDFDTLTGRDIAYGPAKLKVDMSQYQLVVIPNLATDQPAEAWQALDRWLRDPKHAGKRAVAVGKIGNMDARMQPTTGFPTVAARWLGATDYTGSAPLKGKQTVALAGLAAPMTLDFGGVASVGLPAVGEPLLTAGGAVVARTTRVAGNAVLAFGFPLGFASNYGWASCPVQKPADALVPLFEAMVTTAGIERPIVAPANLRVHLSDDGRFLMARERQGLATDCTVAVRLPAGVAFPGLALQRGSDGYARFRLQLLPWTGAYWKAE